MMESNYDQIKKENEKLKFELKLVSIRKKEAEKKYSSGQDIETIKQQEANSLLFLQNQALQNELKTWQKVVDEMAHSINTDVFAALSNLNKESDTPSINKTKHNIKRIRDYANLIMWDLNRSRLPASTCMISIDLAELIKTQIDTIKDGIDSLRLSIREHKAKLLQLAIPVIYEKECALQIDDNIEAGLELIIMDLMRNAFQNTDEENPKITIAFFSTGEIITLQITNNRLISEKEILWFNDDIDDDEIQMSKSAKVGLRLVKRWFKILKMTGKFTVNSDSNETTITLKIPKWIKYEKV